MIRPSIVLPTMPAGLTELALAFRRTDAEHVRDAVERFDLHAFRLMAAPR